MANRRIRSRPTLKQTLTLPVAALRPGMFVTALDRPWEGTPFLLQGFLIDAFDQLPQLRALCKHVVIDPRRSAADSLREVIDLYDLPEEDADPSADEPSVRLRFVESARSAGAIADRTFWPDIGKWKQRIARGIEDLRQSGSDIARMPVPKRAANSPSPADEAVVLPRFSRSQMQYVPVSTADPLPARHRAQTWRKAQGRPGPRNPDHADPAVRMRLAAFDELVRSMGRHLSGWLSSGASKASSSAPPKRLAATLPFRKRRKGRMESPAELGIPPSIEVLIYRDRVGIEVEIGRAREASAGAEEALARLKADFEIERGLRIDGLPEVIDSLVASISRNADALVWVSRVRLQDTTAYNHSLKVASYLMAFGRHLGFPATELAHLAQIGLLMDVGKLELDPELVAKRDPLRADELSMLKRHVEIGLERPSASMALDPAVVAGISQHHEWMNGQGYPNGLAGEQISIFGRMAAIADTYAALTTHRPYAPTLSSYDALQLMYAQADQHLHRPLVEQFVRAIGLYPVGSLVLLSTEEVAVVTALDKEQRLEPRVLVLTEPNKNTRDRPYELDLIKKPRDVHGTPIRIAASLPAGVHNIDFRNFYIA